MSQTIQRAIELVKKTAEEPLSLAQAAEVLGVHKSTALRILRTLEAARFVRKTGAGTYVVGSGLIELSELALGSMDLRQFASAHLRELGRETGHTVHLAQLTGDEIIYIDRQASPGTAWPANGWEASAAHGPGSAAKRHGRAARRGSLRRPGRRGPGVGRFAAGV